MARQPSRLRGLVRHYTHSHGPFQLARASESLQERLHTLTRSERRNQGRRKPAQLPQLKDLSHTREGFWGTRSTHVLLEELIAGRKTAPKEREKTWSGKEVSVSAKSSWRARRIPTRPRKRVASGETPGENLRDLPENTKWNGVKWRRRFPCACPCLLRWWVLTRAFLSWTPHSQIWVLTSESSKFDRISD